jgi:septal ring factor EnvC (AmiA/AmiB activator)
MHLEGEVIHQQLVQAQEKERVARERDDIAEQEGLLKQQEEQLREQEKQLRQQVEQLSQRKQALRELERGLAGAHRALQDKEEEIIRVREDIEARKGKGALHNGPGNHRPANQEPALSSMGGMLSLSRGGVSPDHEGLSSGPSSPTLIAKGMCTRGSDAVDQLLFR